MEKDFLEKFESISEFQRAINTREVHEFYKDILSSENATKTFTGTESYEEAENLLLHGDKGIAAKLVECNGKRMNEAKKNTIYNSPVGFVPNIPNYLSGRPDNMFAVKTQTYKSCKVLNVCVNSAVSFDVTTKDIIAFNQKLLNVVYTLEKRGYRLNLYVGVVAEFSKSKNIGACFIKVKDSGKLLNVTNVAYPLCNASFLRRHFFKWVETNGKTFARSYGCITPRNESEKAIRQLFNRTKNISLIITSDMLYYSESEIMNVIMNDK